MHHANLLVGNKEWALSQIPESERTQGPDVSLQFFDRMSIADVRALIHTTTLMPVAESHRTFVIVANSILGEAQNALLKLFEEPNPTTVFYLNVPKEDILLPTLRSRLNLLAREYTDGVSMEVFTAFRTAGYAERLTLIADKLNAEDGVWVTELVQGLEMYAHETRNAVLMKEVLALLSRIHAPGSSKKMLLEHIALSL